MESDGARSSESQAAAELQGTNLPRPAVSLDDLAPVNDFLGYLVENGIYLDGSLQTQIDAAVKHLTTLEIGIRALANPENVDPNALSEVKSHMIATRDRLLGLHAPIEKTVRQLIGVCDERGQDTQERVG